MSRKEVFVIRIGISLESVAETETRSTPSSTSRDQTETEPSSRERGLTSSPNRSASVPPAKPERFLGRDNNPEEAKRGDARAMSSEQRRTLFRLSYALGDKNGALTRVLEALGVDRLEWATRADASRAIERLRGKPEPLPKGPTNGARHD